MSEGPVCLKCGFPLPQEEFGGRIDCTNCGEVNFLNTPNIDPTEIAQSGVGPGGEIEFSLDPLEPLIPLSSPVQAPPLAATDFEQIPVEEKLENFSDVLEFANTDQSTTATGSLVYSIHLEGVDTAEIREELSQALEDKRLALDTKAILKSVHQGKLDLLRLNPVKASVILSRIKHLPIKVRWTSEQLVKS